MHLVATTTAVADDDDDDDCVWETAAVQGFGTSKLLYEMVDNRNK